MKQKINLPKQNSSLRENNEKIYRIYLLGLKLHFDNLPRTNKTKRLKIGSTKQNWKVNRCAKHINSKPFPTTNESVTASYACCIEFSGVENETDRQLSSTSYSANKNSTNKIQRFPLVPARLRATSFQKQKLQYHRKIAGSWVGN